MRELIEKMYKQFEGLFTNNESYRVHNNREHIQVLLDEFLKNAEGDILEIGAHVGTTTSILCELGLKYGKNVFVIDPWDGRQQGNQSVYEEFVITTAQYPNLKYIRSGSETDESLNFIKNEKFAFIFFDGLHTHDGVMSDVIRYTPFTAKNSIICVDDIRGEYDFCLGIMEAVNELNGINEFEHILSPINFRETFLIKTA